MDRGTHSQQMETCPIADHIPLQIHIKKNNERPIFFSLKSSEQRTADFEVWTPPIAKGGAEIISL